MIPAFQQLAREGSIGGVVLDEGEWMDLGDVASYLRAHRELALEEPLHPRAVIGGGAVVERSVIGDGARIGAGAEVVDCVVWPGCAVEPGVRVEGEVVISGFREKRIR